jgi:bacterial leucyl aminopeptidase
VTINSQIASGRSDITVSQVTHSWAQKSIIVKFGPTSGAITILGAHQDSINQASPTSGRAPGADDNGSGSVGLMETFRQLVAAGFKPTQPLEFHWYAGK